MIIDRVPLAGLDAYLADGSKIDLVQISNHTARSLKLPEGRGIDTENLHLLIEADDLYKLIVSRSDKPIITVRVVKEMFPQLFDDPHSRRVQKVAGFEDFKRGQSSGFRALEVEGVPTLVSTETREGRWRSATYRLPGPMVLDRAAWELALSTRTPANAFSYRLAIEYWTVGQDVDASNGQVLELAPYGTSPEKRRRSEPLGIAEIIAYRLSFDAKVSDEAHLLERHAAMASQEATGTPLLRAINLLETVPSRLAFHSLGELLNESLHYHLFNESAPTRLMAALPLPAVLNAGEYVELTIEADPFKRVQARLEAEVRTRPPFIDNQLG